MYFCNTGFCSPHPFTIWNKTISISYDNFDHLLFLQLKKIQKKQEEGPDTEKVRKINSQGKITKRRKSKRKYNYVLIIFVAWDITFPRGHSIIAPRWLHTFPGTEWLGEDERWGAGWDTYSWGVDDISKIHNVTLDAHFKTSQTGLGGGGSKKVWLARRNHYCI